MMSLFSSCTQATNAPAARKEYDTTIPSGPYHDTLVRADQRSTPQAPSALTRSPTARSTAASKALFGRLVRRLGTPVKSRLSKNGNRLSSGSCPLYRGWGGMGTAPAGQRRPPSGSVPGYSPDVVPGLGPWKHRDGTPLGTSHPKKQHQTRPPRNNRRQTSPPTRGAVPLWGRKAKHPPPSGRPIAPLR
jgi:hypothetical protein